MAVKKEHVDKRDGFIKVVQQNQKQTSQYQQQSGIVFRVEWKEQKDWMASQHCWINDSWG